MSNESERRVGFLAFGAENLRQKVCRPRGGDLDFTGNQKLGFCERCVTRSLLPFLSEDYFKSFSFQDPHPGRWGRGDIPRVPVLLWTVHTVLVWALAGGSGISLSQRPKPSSRCGRPRRAGSEPPLGSRRRLDGTGKGSTPGELVVSFGGASGGSGPASRTGFCREPRARASGARAGPPSVCARPGPHPGFRSGIPGPREPKAERRWPGSARCPCPRRAQEEAEDRASAARGPVPGGVRGHGGAAQQRAAESGVPDSAAKRRSPRPDRAGKRLRRGEPHERPDATPRRGPPRARPLPLSPAFCLSRSLSPLRFATLRLPSMDYIESRLRRELPLRFTLDFQAFFPY
ncbi:hypothetical protein H8959_009743 [Pygathrix nigripes]